PPNPPREDPMKIRHLVHSCLLVELAGRRLLVDPGGFSAEAVRGLDAELLAGLDAVLITHQHPDHVDRALLQEVLERAEGAEVIAEPETAALLAEPADDADAVPAGRLRALPAGDVHELPAVAGEPALRLEAVGGHHASIHPDIPRGGNSGLVRSAGVGAGLGSTAASPAPVTALRRGEG